MQNSRMSHAVLDLTGGIEVHYRLDVGQCSIPDLQTCHPDGEVDREVAAQLQEPVEEEAGMTTGGARTVLVPGPLSIHVDETRASPGVGPSALHAFHSGAREHRRHCSRYLCWIERIDHSPDCTDRAHLVAMHAARQDEALAQSTVLGDDDRHVPVLAARASARPGNREDASCQLRGLRRQVG